MQYPYDHRQQIPVYANGLRDIPEALRRHHWMVPVKFDQLLRLQLKVRMCCHKCEEKVKEEIWEVPGVFDVRVTGPKKVTVVAMPEPFGLDERELLRKARRIDCRAQILDRLKPGPQIQLHPAPPKPPQGPQPPKPSPEVTTVVQPAGWHSSAFVPHYPPSTSWPGDHGPRPSYPPPFQQDYVIFFHIFLLALFVSMLVLR